MLGLFQSYYAAVVEFAVAALVCTVLELKFGTQEHSWGSRVRGFAFSALTIAGFVLAYAASQWLFEALAISPLLRIDLSGLTRSENPLVLVLAYTVVPFASAFVFDFGYYVFHRLQHRVPFLWRFHSVHHAIRELNSFNSYHHLAEGLIRLPLLTLPLGWLVSLSLEQTIVTGWVILIMLHVEHSPVRLSWGPLKYVLSEPRYHRIHHSLERRHWDRNFGFTSPLWDIVFGTAYFPARDEYPKTGLSYMAEARSLRAYLIPPKPGRAAKKAATAAIPEGETASGAKA